MITHLVAAAWAQQAPDLTLDVERFRPTADAMGGATVESAETLGHLQVLVGLWGNRSEDPVNVERNLARVYLGQEEEPSNDGDGALDQRSVVDFQFGFGLYDRFSLTVDLPFVAWQEGFELASAWDPSVGTSIVPTAIGDLRITPKFVLASHKDGVAGLALLAKITAPTGPTRSYLGEGTATVTPTLVFEVADKPVFDAGHTIRVALNVGGLFRKAGTWTGGSDETLVFDDALVWGAMIGVSPGPVFELGVEANGLYGGPWVAQNPVEVLPWMKFRLDRRVAITVGAGVGAVPGLGAPDVRGFAGGSFQPSFDPAVRDRDRDGVVDKEDLCPDHAEDVDGVDDFDGCPDPDNDLDGVDDRVDACLGVAEDRDGFEDQDGCPEADNDADGIPDTADRCPLEPEIENGWQDEDGCPDARPLRDADRDGFLDDRDRCPTDAEDFDGFRDEDGCPDLDNDQDGLGDRVDACPLEPGPAPDGCPVVDRDGDRIHDDRDACPDVPETENGFEDHDGCPDEAPPQRVFVRETVIEITEKVHFAVNDSRIEEVSYNLLDEIARVLQDNPRVESVEVQGHTDSDGDDAYNLELSQRRAEAVVNGLIGRGVDPSRLTARGYGETAPITANDTPENKAANRRVELHIVR
jgi:outer membrane protein OmpA-like peptidoglycan-associated protein